MNDNRKPAAGMPAKVKSMPGRGGVIDRTSTAPGELVARINDRWYLGSAVVPAETEGTGLDCRTAPAI